MYLGDVFIAFIELAFLIISFPNSLKYVYKACIIDALFKADSRPINVK